MPKEEQTDHGYFRWNVKEPKGRGRPIGVRDKKKRKSRKKYPVMPDIFGDGKEEAT